MKSQGFWIRLLFTQVRLVRRLGVPLSMLVMVLVVGSLGYWAVGHVHDKDWSFLDCLFMAVITLTTVGYSDDIGVHAFSEGRIYTILLILLGTATAAYAFGSITAFIVEGSVRKLFRERKMEKTIEGLAGHTIICGGGTTGQHVVAEHLATKQPFIVVDSSQDAMDHLVREHGEIPYIVGDATNDSVLEHAGIHRAKALVSCLTSDKDNLFLVVAARYRRKDVPIVVKVIDHDTEGRFRAAGATQVVNATHIGGMRLASLVVRPTVVAFLDTMLRGRGNARVSEALVIKGSQLDGKRLADVNIQDRLGLSVVAVKKPGDEDFTYGPRGDTTLIAGTTVVVVGALDRVPELESLARA